MLKVKPPDVGVELETAGVSEGFTPDVEVVPMPATPKVERGPLVPKRT
jgi:hypothetical protein